MGFRGLGVLGWLGFGVFIGLGFRPWRFRRFRDNRVAVLVFDTPHLCRLAEGGDVDHVPALWGIHEGLL